jgi:hypothetical protein
MLALCSAFVVIEITKSKLEPSTIVEGKFLFEEVEALAPRRFASGVISAARGVPPPKRKHY